MTTKFRIFCSSPGVIRVVTWTRTRQAKHVERTARENMYTGLRCENLKEKVYLEN